MRFLSRRRLLALFGVIALVIVALTGGVVAYVNSSAFDRQARQYINSEIARRTGAEVTLSDFDWSFWQRRFRLNDLTLRGLEPPEEAPLAHFGRIDIGLNFGTLFQRKVDLFELTLTRPEFHVLFGPDGKTNFPSPEAEDGRKLDFQISIENFNIVDGSALVNERKVHIDFSLRNISALLNYQGSRQVLETHLRFDGVFDRHAEGKPPIPYTLSADMDYTRATLMAHKMTIRSGRTEIKLQGRINDLNKNIAGKLEYTGNVHIPFLNYFFTKERFEGNADVAGQLEFSKGYFFTRGKTASEAVDFEGWHAAKVRGDYTYRYPDRKIEFRQMKSEVVGGGVSGNIFVENIPGKPRVVLDLDYSGIDAAALARAYPWDKKYRIFSRMSGTLNGWFEGKIVRYEFAGHADFQSYTPPDATDLVPLPLDGSTDYEARPREANVANAAVRLYSTDVKADGLIHETMSGLKVSMSSSNLKDAVFLYPDANGAGTFEGTLTGRIARPVLDGDFTLRNHVYQDWTIQQASGGVRLDTEAENAVLRSVLVTQGKSAVLINGAAAWSGSPVDLRVQSNRVTGPDLRVFANRNVDGLFSGNVRITSLSPAASFEGDLRADDLTVDGLSIGNSRGHVRYADTSIEITDLSIRQNQASLTGSVAFNQANDAVRFSLRGNSVDLEMEMFRRLGFPDTVRGVVQQADLRGDGTASRPNIRGEAALRNLSFYGEVFPQARMELTSAAGSEMNVRLDTGRNLALSAQIETASPGYPFKATANFKQYPVERIAKLSEGTISATGTANFSGMLTDRTRLHGEGRIESAEARVQQTALRTTKPFTFGFNSDELSVTALDLAGQSTTVTLTGTIGLTELAPLNLNVEGRVDLALISAAYPAWTSGGAITVDGRIGGTVRDPDLRGIAHLVNASLGRRGFFMTLTNVNGDVFFSRDQIMLNGVEGRMRGGAVRARGAASIERGAIQKMNIQIEADDVGYRGTPEGLRAVLVARLVLSGSWSSPLLEGNVQIQSLAYRSSFEEFLAMLTERSVSGESSPLGRVQLSTHVEGSRNITIQNQLADVEARIDVDVKGTLDKPSVTGHIEASGGTLLFQGNRYRIIRGNMDFVDPLRIEPVVDVQAESEVRDYRVILSVTGRGDKLNLHMRSDPPLPDLEIVNLIAGGRTREEIATRLGATAPTSEQLFQRGAASILFDLLQQRVGNRAGLLGLDRVRIDPSLLGASNNPGARITLSEQVTKDLSVTYSQDLSSNRQQVLLIEYFLNRNTSILASRDELGKGLDIRFRKRLK